jgi:HJR/Mrr/RecB family endonuclease
MPSMSDEIDENDIELVERPLGSISFANLDATEFEEFCFDLLIEVGFVNVDWRKGTPKKASPSDRGRDMVAQLERVDVDGHKYFETWFVDAKHYKRGVPPEALQGLLTWSEAERPTTALVVASGFLSNPAKDWLDAYQRNRHPPFRTRHWEKPTLQRMLGKHKK